MREEPIALTTLRFILWLATVNFLVFIYCSYLSQQRVLDEMKKSLDQHQRLLNDLKKQGEELDSMLCECRNLLFKTLPEQTKPRAERAP